MPSDADISRPILITSFRPWRAHQASNSSDDLLRELHRQLPADVIWLPQVPVSFQLAPMQVICELYRLRPRLVICCGMAESRSCLSLEKKAQGPTRSLSTTIDLPPLLTHTVCSEISYDAGNYVCNHLYYSVLEFVESSSLEMAALFIHVPILSLKHKKSVMADFLTIFSRLAAQDSLTDIPATDIPATDIPANKNFGHP